MRLLVEACSKSVILLLTIATLMCSCQQNLTTLKAKSKRYDMKMIFEVLDVDQHKSQVSWSLINQGNLSLPASGWAVYFNQLANNVDSASVPSMIAFEQMAGDFHRMSPTESFSAIAPNDTITFTYQINTPMLRTSFLPAGVYIAYDDDQSYDMIEAEHMPLNRTLYSEYNPPTAASRFRENMATTLLPEVNLTTVIPRPNSFMSNGQVLTYNESVNIVVDESFQTEAEILSAYLQEVFTGPINIINSTNADTDGRILLVKLPDEALAKEAYTLQVKDDGITLQASHAAGMFYALQSLRQLIDIQDYAELDDRLTVTNVRIDDAPRFAYRGLHLDVARNFHSKETVLKILDLMAMYKLNVFHFHLTDDEGWRIEIDGLPELTTIASRRGHTTDESDHIYPAYGSGPDPDESYGSGYYSRADFIEILQYAHERHIEVIPEIDLPGHMRAAIIAMTNRYHKYMDQGNEAAAMEYLLEDFDDKSEYLSAQQYDDNAMCVCRESAFTFITRIVDDLAAMYKEADAPFTTFHSGGDEVAYGAWHKSPVCQEFIKNNPDLNSPDDLHAYVLKRFKKILAKHDLISAGWEEILLKHGKEGHQGTDINEDLIGENVRAYVWNAVWGWGREDMAYKLANSGFPVVLCNSAQLYLDMAYNTDPEEIGLSWSGFSDTKSAYDVVPYDLYKTAKVEDYDSFIKGKVALTAEGRNNILGVQGQIWSETLRDEESLFYMMFPKFISLAERAWSEEEPWESSSREDIFTSQARSWNELLNTIGQKDLPRLDRIHGGIPYRIPLPGAVVDNGILKANVKFPGLDIRYTTDGSEPTVSSQLYEGPVQISGKEVKLKTFNSTGRSSRTSTVLRG